MHVKAWDIQVYISEEGDETHARAVMIGDAKDPLTATGKARRNPVDKNVPEIGDELATARALADLSHQLIEMTARDIEAVQSSLVILPS